MLRFFGKYLLLTVIFVAPALWASDFAAQVISFKGPFGPSPYNEPNSVTGKPSAYVVGEGGSMFVCSLVYPAWNVTPQGGKVIVTLGAGAEIVAGFDHRVSDDINNPYGIDFIVFGNSAFKKDGTDYITPDTDMDILRISAGAEVLEEWVTVSVAADPNGPWHTFSSGPWADSLFPTNAFAWDGSAHTWGSESDWLKPVDPNLARADFGGLTASAAIALYEGSAGGTGFDLQWLAPQDYAALPVDPVSGRRWIRYIKVTSDEYGEVDGFSDVASCGDYQHPFPPGDVNTDCRVDIADLAVISENWLVCTWQCESE